MSDTQAAGSICGNDITVDRADLPGQTELNKFRQYFEIVE